MVEDWLTDSVRQLLLSCDHFRSSCIKYVVDVILMLTHDIVLWYICMPNIFVIDYISTLYITCFYSYYIVKWYVFSVCVLYVLFFWRVSKKIKQYLFRRVLRDDVRPNYLVILHFYKLTVPLAQTTFRCKILKYLCVFSLNII